MARISVYTPGGMFLTDIRAIFARTWVLNGVGDGSFSVPYTSNKYREDYLTPGNIVVVKHEKLPEWIGVIADDMNWGGAEVRIKCNDAIALLSYRSTDAEETLVGTPGSQVEQLINYVNAIDDTRLRPGAICEEGEEKSLQLGDFALVHLKTIQRRSGHSWQLESAVGEDNMLVINVNWLERAGQDIASLMLVEGANMERGQQPLTQRGPIINSLTAYSQASTPQTRLRYVAQVDASISQYGLRQATKVFDVKTEAALISVAEASVKVSAWPTRASSIAVLDIGSVFDNLALGNVLPVRFVTVGFQGGSPGLNADFGIAGMKYTSGSRCELTVKQVME
jgi:hypothetical protein